MWPREGGDDLRQRAEMEMQKAADGMMVVEPVSLGGEGADASGTLESLDARNQAPSAALVAADHCAAGTEPAVVQ